MRRFFLIVWLLLMVGGVIWWIRYAPDSPTLSLADWRRSPTELHLEPKRLVQDIDSQVAKTIRSMSENGVQFPQVANTQFLNDFASATVSASVSTSPEELWQTMREEGARSVVSGLAKNANVSVNDISANVVHEARYQYCLGVVEEYEDQKQPL